MLRNPLPLATSILIVDDDRVVRDALGDYLKTEGYTVCAVDLGGKAIDAVSQTLYSAVLLDVRLPDIDGHAVLDMLIRIDPTLPVIMLTSYSSDDHGAGALAKGAFAFLMKPYRLPEIIATLRRAVTLRALEARTAEIETALSEQEEQFRCVVEAAPDAIIVADQDGRVASWNRAAETLFQYTAAEILGQSLTRIMPPRYRAGHERSLDRLRSNPELRTAGRTIELHGLRKDGTEFPLELSLAMWKARKGRFYSGIIRDISQRKATEEALRESEERFRQMAETIREVFWMTTPEKDRMIYVSPAYEQLFGRTCESLYNSPSSWLEAVHPEDRPCVRQAALTQQCSGDYNVEYRLLRADGSTRWVWDRAFPIRDPSGQVYRVAGIAEDITDRKTAEAALRQTHDVMERVLAGLPGAILMVDAESRVTYANALAAQTLGRDDESSRRGSSGLVGHTIEELLPLTRAQWSRYVEQLAKNEGREHRHIEGSFEATHRNYRYRLFPVPQAESEPRPMRRQIGVVVWDVTEQLLLQEQLIQAEKLATVGTLLSGMAHEINNPMQGILGMGEIILQEKDPVKIREYANDIVGYSQHVASVVRDFVAYARPASRHDGEELDLSERLEEAIKMVRRDPAFGQITVLKHFEPLPKFRAKRSEIDQVFVNTVMNAVQAMQGEGELALTTRQEEDAMIAEVADTGCGIPASIVTKIFDPFFTTKDPGKGTGLGLSIVYKIVTKYGGSVQVKSEAGKGSCFSIRFPVRS